MSPIYLPLHHISLRSSQIELRSVLMHDVQFHVCTSNGVSAIRYKTERKGIAFLGVLTYSKSFKILHTHSFCETFKRILWVLHIGTQKQLNSATMFFCIDEPLHMLWPTDMNFVWQMYQPKTYKKVSCTHILTPTGSPLFWIYWYNLIFCQLNIFL